MFITKNFNGKMWFDSTMYSQIYCKILGQTIDFVI
ncbi:hypothetical protein [Salmonella phage PHA46]